MNELKDDDIWLTAAEIASLKLETLPNSKAAVLNWAKDKNWKKKKRKGAGGGYFYSFLSFPQEAQQEIKNDLGKWQQVCKISQNRHFYTVINTDETFPKNKQKEFKLSPADKDFTLESAHRFIFEEINLGIKRDGLDGLSSKLGISVEELEKYEHGEKPLNIVHIKKLSELGFDVMYIIFGIRKKREKQIHNEVSGNNNKVEINN